MGGPGNVASVNTLLELHVAVMLTERPFSEFLPPHCPGPRRFTLEDPTMATPLKPTVAFDDTLGRLDIRLGKVVRAEPEPSAPKPAYRLTVDFGKYGLKTSVGRFTQQTPDQLVGQLVVGVLNFEARPIGEVASEVLILGVQVPGAESGEATVLTPLIAAKLGSKVF